MMMTGYGVTDAELIQEYLIGDEDALSVLIKRHKSRIYRFVCSKISDKDVADDIFQDTIIKVIKTLKSGTYKEQGVFLSWVFRISQNLIMDYHRKNKRKPLSVEKEGFSIFSLIPDDSQSIENKLISNQIEKDLNKLVKTLPLEQKEVLIMRLYEGVGFKEIAELKGISINTALGRMRYALMNLRKEIAKNQIVLTY
jgi:RNA polymerase sigma-70 factor (ECF subfamily)